MNGNDQIAKAQRKPRTVDDVCRPLPLQLVGQIDHASLQHPRSEHVHVVANPSVRLDGAGLAEILAGGRP
jgi:hypothetical protein